ncbi:uncharacterized protein LOC124675331 isoform X1 [Lolium rigidum]|uniref:uncharacterized protein LOC124675331 isoform X1 n=1 Tax=Lolium rigidum TaxID=89674 RepID=UPI001F5CDCF0|nr:uncharacterized protein LOC124675331 isoform X1 [Lolium rigidum]
MERGSSSRRGMLQPPSRRIDSSPMILGVAARSSTRGLMPSRSSTRDLMQSRSTTIWKIYWCTPVLFFMASSSRSEAFYMVNTSRESHMNVEWCNKTQVGYESLLESPPGFGSQELHSSVVDDPNCPLAPSTLKMIEKRLLSQKVQADAQFKTKKA